VKQFGIITGSWLAVGTIAFAAVGEIRIGIWLGVAASFVLFVSIVEGRMR
jgi:hypothetical protein